MYQSFYKFVSLGAMARHENFKLRDLMSELEFCVFSTAARRFKSTVNRRSCQTDAK